MINAYVNIKSVTNELTSGVSVHARTFELRSNIVINSIREEDRRLVLAIDWLDDFDALLNKTSSKPTMSAIKGLLEDMVVDVFMFDRHPDTNLSNRTFSHYQLMNPSLYSLWFEFAKPLSHPSKFASESKPAQTYLMISIAYDEMDYRGFINTQGRPFKTLGFSS